MLAGIAQPSSRDSGGCEKGGGLHSSLFRASIYASNHVVPAARGFSPKRGFSLCPCAAAREFL